MAETLHGVIGRKFALAYLLEQGADGFGVHGEQSALSIQPSAI